MPFKFEVDFAGTRAEMREFIAKNQSPEPKAWHLKAANGEPPPGAEFPTLVCYVRSPAYLAAARQHLAQLGWDDIPNPQLANFNYTGVLGTA
jgi:hypothetical protein